MRIGALAVAGVAALILTGCSTDEDFLRPYHYLWGYEHEPKTGEAATAEAAAAPDTVTSDAPSPQADNNPAATPAPSPPPDMSEMRVPEDSPSPDTASLSLPASTAQDENAGTEYCRGVAEQRSADARLNGYDEDERDAVYAGTYRDCKAWRARHQR